MLESCEQHGLKHRWAWGAIGVVGLAVLLLGLAAPAGAQDVTISTPTLFSTLPNPFVVNGDLTITSTGSILCPGWAGHQHCRDRGHADAGGEPDR